MQDIHSLTQEELELLKERSEVSRLHPVDALENLVECNQVEVVGYPPV